MPAVYAAARSRRSGASASASSGCGRARADFSKASSCTPDAPPCSASRRSWRTRASRASIHRDSVTGRERAACGDNVQ